jgi:hypothetical protein
MGSPPEIETRRREPPIPGPRKTEDSKPQAPPAVPAAPPAVSVAPTIDREERARIVSALRFYSQKLDIDPGNRTVALAYANDVATIAALRDGELACSSLEHWKNYAASNCWMVDADALRLVDAQLAALRAVCPTSPLDEATLLRCAKTP